MNYLTLYTVFDKNDKKIWENSNKSCFAEIFRNEIVDTNCLNFNESTKGHYIEIYQFLSNDVPAEFSVQPHYTIPDLNIAKKWVKTLNNWGLPCSITQRIMNRPNTNIPWQNPTNTIVFTIKYDDYLSKNQFKLTFYYLRWLWETWPKFLIDLYTIKKTHLKLTVFEMIQICPFLLSSSTQQGHITGLNQYYGQSLVSLRQFKQAFKKSILWDGAFNSNIWKSAGAFPLPNGRITNFKTFVTADKFNIENYKKLKEILTIK